MCASKFRAVGGARPRGTRAGSPGGVDGSGASPDTPIVLRVARRDPFGGTQTGSG